MTNFLDEYPQNWANPQYAQLRDLLVACAYREGMTYLRNLANDAGIVPGTFPEGYDNVRTACRALIEEMGSQEKLRRLVEIAASLRSPQ